jgi:VCBS repeat-containing protein
LDADVPAGVSESDFKLHRYNGTFAQIPATVNPAANTATATGISQFSDWTLIATASTGNQPPVANNDSYSVNEDNALSVSAAQGVLANDTDAENNSLTAAIVAQPANGTVTLNPNGSFVYQPNPNFNGTDSFSYKANDGSADSNTATVNITIAAVNDAPTFTAGANQTVVSSAGAQTIANWATNISAGAANEAGQTLNFIVTNNNNALFAAQPMISPTGTLTFTPAAGAVGTATVSVVLQDSGGTANGGQNSSAPQTFTITVSAPQTFPGTFAFSSSTYSAGEGGGTITITVNRTGGSDGAVTVNYAAVSATATGGNSCATDIDFINTSGTLTFAGGVTTRTFDITICNDLIFEPTETINLSLTNAGGGATLGTPATAVVNINDDDAASAIISINNVRQSEGSGGNRIFNFTATLAAPSSQPVSVAYQTGGGTATAGVDYIAIANQTLTFAPGQTTATVSVTVIGDTLKEANETFFVNLSNPTNATIAADRGTGIIVDDDRSITADFDGDGRTDFQCFVPATVSGMCCNPRLIQ